MTRSRSPKPGLTVTARRLGGKIVALGVEGHAGFAPRGRDIVCAAVSALVLSAAYGVRTHGKAGARVLDEAGGDYRLEVARGGNARAQAILETALAGLRAVARSYPRSVRVRTVAGESGPPKKRSGSKARAART